jgi:hypothetical protein
VVAAAETVAATGVAVVAEAVATVVAAGAIPSAAN